jgi:hypothetical protein
MAGEVGNLLAGADVIETDDPGVAGSGQKGVCRREGEGSHGFDES